MEWFNDIYKNTIQKINEKNAIKIQATWRGYIIRKKLINPKDNMNIINCIALLNNYNKTKLLITEINKSLSIKKIRQQNFPSEISENIIKFYFIKRFKISPCWDIKSGDLELLGKKIEVKGFSSDGPCSFGPTENWSWIYFVDCKKSLQYYFTIYELKLSNKSDLWKNLKINKIQTFEDQCKQKRRPRIRFIDIKEQLNEFIKKVFQGNIMKLIL